MQEEALLIRRAKKGDADAFEALVAPLEQKLYALCLRMLTSREDALDCAQDAMLRIWRSMGTFREQASFGTWCYRIATNACLDYLRKQKVRPSVSLEAMTEIGFAPAAGGGDNPAERLEEGDRRQALIEGIASLSPDLRAAVVLRDIHGLSYEEVSEALQTPLGTVKSRINRARERLRGNLFASGELFEAQGVYTGERRKEP